MKYGMRERISGAVILTALAVIFVPMLFDEPAPREERPEPVLTIEQPVPVERHDVPEPQPPDSLDAGADSDAPAGDSADGESATADETVALDGAEAVSEGSADEAQDTDASIVADEADATERAASADDATQEAPVDDPIAELARTASARLEGSAASAEEGEGAWAVQVGSFGDPANAERLENRLAEQGYSAYRRQRDNDLTTVYVGPFASSEEGERVMGELKQNANLQGLLVRVRE
ncbi:SPOR domain-containing protein [Billgrantia gudaonensis]|uniref:DedD protein n=1 Tax=Billgrantia gudaonensis TaxID=376427 RepID=A0A1G8T8H3_9GAMM|nr:SPOR domain-containing protein [Halomonas gudaonensis]SDJ37856.1 DedD protein [Halomonas gudaonensis]